MGQVTTMAPYLWPLMDISGYDTDHCIVCGRTHPLNRHHLVRRGAGELWLDGHEVPKPLVTLCGSGTTGCHGLVHALRLHLRATDGRLEYKIYDHPTSAMDAMGDQEGWMSCRT